MNEMSQVLLVRPVVRNFFDKTVIVNADFYIWNNFSGNEGK